MTSDLIPFGRDLRDGSLVENAILDHMIERQIAGQCVPVYVVGDQTFIYLVKRNRLSVKRDERSAYCELDWPTVVQVRAGGVRIEWHEVSLEER